jgi:histidine triad (HIT) family protein
VRGVVEMLKEECIFCKIINGQIPAKTVFEDNKVMAFGDIKPQAPVHVVIIPKHHIDGLSTVSDEHANLIGRLVMTAKHIASQMNVDQTGYRLVLNCNRDGGQEVFHLHLHMLGGRPMAWPPG